MRVRIVPLSTALLPMVFRPASDPQVVVTSDWPEDAEIVNAEWDFVTRQVRLMVTSETFDDVLPGFHPIEWTPTFFARHVSGSLMELFEKMNDGGA